jgi:hypothetical protein
MKLFTCTSCGQVLFFENVQCTRCGARLAYLPEHRVVSALEAEKPSDPAEPSDVAAVFVALAPAAERRCYRLCVNYVQHGVCNWAVPTEHDDALCHACRLTTTIPDVSNPSAKEAWGRLEIAKRRLLYTLIELGLPVEPRDATGNGLAFAFVESRDGEHVVTGHAGGVITINVAEADDPFREAMRRDMGEAYRTLLGHCRHEIGHYYWDRLVRDTSWLEPFRARFGDERADYAHARDRHYASGPPADWATSHVSAYASMHPWEDWAETFAHYLHMVDTLETARSYGLALRPAPVGGPSLPPVTARRLGFDDVDDLVTAWVPLTIALNSLNRGMGLPDLYPFVLSDEAVRKLQLVHDIVDETAGRLRAS